MHKPTRRQFVQGVLAGAAAVPLIPGLGVRDAYAAWPDKPMKIIVGFPAGGLTDAWARAYGEYIQQKSGQTVVVENKAGAGSAIAAEQVAKSAPDGTTFLFTISTAWNQNTILYKKLPYDPKDFVYISGFGAGQLPMGVHKDVKATNLKEFIELGKKGQKLTMGNYAPGSYPQMVAQQLNKLYGLNIESIAYRGEAPMWQDVASGTITAAIGSVQAMLPHVQAGNVRAIGQPTSSRSPKLADVPTFGEQGFKEPIFVLEGWLGMFAPAGTPAPIVKQLSDWIQEGYKTEKIQKIHENFGIPQRPWTNVEFEELQKKVGPQWVGLAKELGVTLD
ncbi:MAG: Tripartite tricarboxylate transporter family receptor [Alphaproteobacteria bacterium]|jgi:tripartite-type tricarboxylate transporter receptor subunit TctC|nr:Tripartite tricarboxylate transporter family receptor [Alphaproteobacteria bacterium]